MHRYPTTRVVTVQGPFQLLCALAVMFYKQETQEVRSYDDYLVIHGLCVSPPADKIIKEAIVDIARVWPWKQIVYLAEFERRLELGHYRDVGSMMNVLFETVGVIKADVILAARNWQTTNDILLKAYQDAHKIVYGDGLGEVDAYSSPNYVQFDEACVTMPVEWFSQIGEPIISLSSIPLTIMPKQYFLHSIDRYLSISEPVHLFCERIRDNAKNSVLVLTENATEAGITRLEEEIQIYIKPILRMIQPGDSVFLKPHPREIFNQCFIIKNILTQYYNINAETFDREDFMRALPVEIICRGVQFKKVISPLLSGASCSLKCLYDIDCYISPEFIENLNVRYRNIYLKQFEICTTVIERLNHWEGKSILYARQETDRKLNTKLPS
jgi:hypothetical protein